MADFPYDELFDSVCENIFIFVSITILI